jgi:hypothetical protein
LGERLKDAIDVIGRNTTTAIAYDKNQYHFLSTELNIDPSGAGKLDRVVDEVHEDLANLASVRVRVHNHRYELEAGEVAPMKSTQQKGLLVFFDVAIALKEFMNGCRGGPLDAGARSEVEADFVRNTIEPM